MTFRIVTGKISNFITKKTGQVPRDYEIAEALGMTRASYATSKTRKRLPYENILFFCFKNRINANVLFFGELEGHDVRIPSQIKDPICA